MSKQSTSTTGFSSHEGVIKASVVHEVLPKLNSKLHYIKSKLQSIYVQRYVVTNRSQKRVNLWNGVHPRRRLYGKDMLGKRNRHT